MALEPLGMAVFRSTSESVWLLDENGRTVWGNDRLASLLGESIDQLQSRRFADFSTDNAAAECLQSCISEGVSQQREMSFVKRGTIGCADVRLIPFANANGAAVLAMITDVTRERQAEAAMLCSLEELERRVGLEDVSQRGPKEEDPDGYRNRLLVLTSQILAANKELEAFSYSVSHDLREPLRSIDGFSRILLERYGSVLDERGKDYLSRVRAAAQRMGQLIADMLTLARIARADMSIEPVNISRLSRLICDELAESDPARPVEFRIADDLTVAGDPRLLTVVLTNLLGNSWKFTSKCANARIELSRVASETEDVFLIADNGAGFEMKYVEKLFRPFQRLHSDADYMGTGVGLATVQRIIARHGGRVWAEATVGKGARLFVSLPRATASSGSERA